MKKRRGFVSNSSSSSFICEVCGEAESGYDMSLADAGFYECEEGHVFCIDHIDFSIDSPPLEIKKVVIAKFKVHQNYDLPWLDRRGDQKERILKFIEEHDDEYFETEFEEEMMSGYGIPKEACPICTMKEIGDSDVLSYILLKSTGNKESFKNEIRERFSSYREFRKHLTEKE